MNRLFCLLFALALIPHSSRVIAADNSPDGDDKARVAFGGSVLIDGNRAFVGRTGISTRYPEPVWQFAGVHVYNLVGNSWTETATVAPSDGTLGDRFGHAMASSGDLLAVAAPLKNMATGGVYVFRYSSAGLTAVEVGARR